MRLAIAIALAGAMLAPAPAAAIVNADGTGPVPWTALVRMRFTAQADGRCGAAVRDALHVITAAHCTFDVTARGLEPIALAPRALSVTAGVARVGAGAPGAQRRGVVAVSSDPAFAASDGAAVHDDAVLTLDRPLDLGDPRAVTALAPVAAGARAAGGRFAGFGRPAARQRGNRALRYADLDVLPARACARYGARFDPAVMLCGGRRDGDAPAPGGCNGDSGGALASGARVVGVASFVGPDGCGDRRFPTVFVRVADPGINAFLAQPDPIPRPAVLARPAVVGAGASAVPGDVVRCLPGRWSGGRDYTYEFDRAFVVDGTADAARHVVVAGPSRAETYRLTGADFATAVFCVVRAAGPGGAVAAASANALGPAGPVPVRDGAAPASRFTTVVCAPGRCTARLVASDDARLAGARLGASLRRVGRPGRRAVRVEAHAHGRYTLRTPRLEPGRWRLVAAVTDAAGNQQARPATITLSVRR